MQAAVQLGIFDEVVAGDVVPAAVAFAVGKVGAVTVRCGRAPRRGLSATHGCCVYVSM